MHHGSGFATTALIHILLCFAPSVRSFYLPGVAPTTYREGQIVPLFVNRLTPSTSYRDATVRSVLAFDYYHESFHFCQPERIRDQSESLGSILFGDRIQSSPFELRMKQDQRCRTIPKCAPQTFTAEDAKFVNKRIEQTFMVNWLIDGLPAGQWVTDPTTLEDFMAPGFDLGSMQQGQPVLNNHFEITVMYHEPTKGAYRVVGVEVRPGSDAHSKDNGDGTAECDLARPDPLILNEESETRGVVFTYSVTWQSSSTPFATRWDQYLHVYDPKIHWFSLINSAVIVMFLSATVFVVLVRTLRRDITRFNKLDAFVLEDLSNGHARSDSAASAANGHATATTMELDDGVAEDSGWKLIHGDVFRPPKRPLILAILVGNGAQLFLMTGFTILFAMLGFLSPSNRGSLGSVMVLLYTLFASVGGAVAAYTYKNLGGQELWRQLMVLTPVALPTIVFAIFFLLNLFLWAKGASGAVPFTTMLVIVLIWFLVSIPLSLAGSWLAFKRPAKEPPCRTNQIPRQIPEAGSVSGGGSLASWLSRPVPGFLLTGIPPFVAIFFELYFIMSSLWSAKIYYMFGFLFLCFGLMIVSCATVTILATYFQLCSENYHWQWRSFAVGGACALYIFLNALVFWMTRLKLGSITSGVLYLGYSALISGLVFILTGFIGFTASFFFVHRIYRSIKVD